MEAPFFDPALMKMLLLNRQSLIGTRQPSEDINLYTLIENLTAALTGQTEAINNGFNTINATLLAGFETIGTKLDDVNINLAAVNGRLDKQYELSNLINEELREFHQHMNNRIDTVNDNLDSLEVKTDTTNTKLDVANESLDSIETKLDTSNEHFVTIEGKIDTMDAVVDSIKGNTDTIIINGQSTNTKLDTLITNSNKANDKLDTANNNLTVINDNLTDTKAAMNSQFDESQLADAANFKTVINLITNSNDIATENGETLKEIDTDIHTLNANLVVNNTTLTTVKEDTGAIRSGVAHIDEDVHGIAADLVVMDSVIDEIKANTDLLDDESENSIGGRLAAIKNAVYVTINDDEGNPQKVGIATAVDNDLNEVVEATKNIKITADTINLNTDELENKLDQVIEATQNIKINTENVNLNTDTLETLIGETNTKLQSVIDGNTANVDEIKTAIGEVKTSVDTVKTGVDTVNTTLGTTNETLTSVDTTAESIKTAVENINTNTSNPKDYTTVLNDIKTAVGTTNTTLTTTNTKIDTLDGVVDNILAKTTETDTALDSMVTNKIGTPTTSGDTIIKLLEDIKANGGAQADMTNVVYAE